MTRQIDNPMASPKDWLKDRINGTADRGELRAIAWELVEQAEDETIEASFKDEMTADGYYDEEAVAGRAGEDTRDPDYERAAARDRADDFARTGGKDWT